MVLVSMDYCYLTEGVKASETDHTDNVAARVSMTMLVMIETLCRSVWAYAVQSKGATEDWLSEQIVKDLETIGLRDERLILKADQESSITDIQRAVARMRKGYGTAIEQSRVGDSNSNGRVERAIQDVKGLTRTLRSALEENIKAPIRLDDAVVPWMVRHAAHLINISRIRADGRTAWQKMKGRRSNGSIQEFCEAVLFKVPKTHRRVGSFEDRWELGCWLGCVSRSGEQLVGTSQGVYKVSAVMRRPPGERWCTELVQGIKGSPAEPIPGSGSRHITAFAKKAQDETSKDAVYIPAPEPTEEPEVRAAKVCKQDVETHGGSERCPGCKALKHGTYRAKNIPECRQRFERILQQYARAKQRFDKAHERRMEGITRKAMAMQAQVEETETQDTNEKASTQDNAAAGGRGGGSGSAGSGATAAQRRGEVQAQNERELQAGMKASLETSTTAAVGSEKTNAEEEADDSGRQLATESTLRGTKRVAEEDLDDSERTQAKVVEETTQTDKSVTKGVKRKDENQDDAARNRDRADDMSSLEQAKSTHPGATHTGEKFTQGELEWRHIGSGVFARTFPKANKLVTTTKNGPPIQ